MERSIDKNNNLVSTILVELLYNKKYKRINKLPIKGKSSTETNVGSKKKRITGLLHKHQKINVKNVSPNFSKFHYSEIRNRNFLLIF